MNEDGRLVYKPRREAGAYKNALLTAEVGEYKSVPPVGVKPAPDAAAAPTRPLWHTALPRAMLHVLDYSSVLCVTLFAGATSAVIRRRNVPIETVSCDAVTAAAAAACLCVADQPTSRIEGTMHRVSCSFRGGGVSTLSLHLRFDFPGAASSLLAVARDKHITVVFAHGGPGSGRSSLIRAAARELQHMVPLVYDPDGDVCTLDVPPFSVVSAGKVPFDREAEFHGCAAFLADAPDAVDPIQIARCAAGGAFCIVACRPGAVDATRGAIECARLGIRVMHWNIKNNAELQPAR